MVSIDFKAINYWAVLVSAVATFLVGGLWYTALFGKQRTELLGYSDAVVQEMAKSAARTFSTLFVCYVVVAFVVAMVYSVLGVESAGQGAQWGFLLWLGLAAAIGLTGNITTTIPLGVFLIDAGYQLVFLVMTGAIVGAWHK